jgi:esterase/lipase
MAAQMTPVTFRNKEGILLFGILHQPERPCVADTAILLLSPGVKMRVAPHRLYNKMAARFLSLGYPVLRFDFHALGDSEGEAPEALLADFYGATQAGRYVGDTVAAMDWMQQAHGISRFVASGLCGGALTGLLAAARDPRIIALMGLSIPVTRDGANIDASLYMTDKQLKGSRSRYLRKLKLWDPQVWRSWMRFVTFQSHYSLIVRSLSKPFQTRLRAAPAPAEPAAAADNTNPLFAPAFRAMVSTSRPVFLVFAETDRLLWEFEAKFMQRHRATVDAHAEWYRFHVTKQANHIFSFAEWQRDMLDQCCQWLNDCIARPTADGHAIGEEPAAALAAPIR